MFWMWTIALSLAFAALCSVAVNILIARGMLREIRTWEFTEATAWETGKTAELRIAFSFDCDECGREMFVRSIRIEDSGNPALVRFDGPKSVACGACGATFRTELSLGGPEELVTG